MTDKAERSVWRVRRCHFLELEKELNDLARDGYMALKFIKSEIDVGQVHVIAYDPVMQTRFLQDAANNTTNAELQALIQQLAAKVKT